MMCCALRAFGRHPYGLITKTSGTVPQASTDIYLSSLYTELRAKVIVRGIDLRCQRDRVRVHTAVTLRKQTETLTQTNHCLGEAQGVTLNVNKTTRSQ
jgi:hypothetical protein